MVDCIEIWISKVRATFQLSFKIEVTEFHSNELKKQSYQLFQFFSVSLDVEDEGGHSVTEPWFYQKKWGHSDLLKILNCSSFEKNFPICVNFSQNDRLRFLRPQKLRKTEKVDNSAFWAHLNEIRSIQF